MPRPALSEAQVEEFRESLCDAATRLFAERGYDGVTLRALAAELGVSPMTPYRYFRDKAEIFHAVRISAFERFADAQQAAADSSTEHFARLRALGHAYVRFALDEPHAYRIMFELDPGAPSPEPEEARAWLVMRGAVGEAVEAGEVDGDADLLAHLYWASVHGMVALHLAGKLVLGRKLDELVEALMNREFKGDGR